MRFRHLDYSEETPVAELGPAALDDLLDRGDLLAWQPIARAVRSDPHGAMAEMILQLCRSHAMYGTSALWIAWIERLRGAGEQTGISLPELRALAGATQQEIAGKMNVSQSDVSKLERRSDAKLSTIRAYVAALGGTVTIRVRLPKRRAPIDISL